MKSYSQCAQDRFVWEILGRKTDGLFLDVGAHDGVTHSNTKSLEMLGWHGLLVDIQHLPKVDERLNFFRQVDAVTADWKSLFAEFFEGQTEIDYLSLDVDDATTTVLTKLMMQAMRYRVITIEHDLYRLGPSNATVQRAVFAEKGYELMCRDVWVEAGEWGGPGPFEDFWVTKDLMTPDNFRRFGSFNELGKEIVARL